MPRATRTPTRASPPTTSANSLSPARSGKGKQKVTVEVAPLERRQSRRQSARQGSAKSSNPDNDEPANSPVPPSHARSASPVDEKPTLEPVPDDARPGSPSSKTSLSSKQIPIPTPVPDRSVPAPEQEDSPLTDLESYPTSPAKPSLAASQELPSTTSKSQDGINEVALVSVAIVVDPNARTGTSVLEGSDSKIGNRDQSISPSSPVILPLLASAASTRSTPSSPPDLAAFDKPAVLDRDASKGGLPIPPNSSAANQEEAKVKEGIRQDLQVANDQERGVDSIEEPIAVALLETASDAGTVVENEHQEVTLESVDLDVTLDSVDSDDTFDESSASISTAPIIPPTPAPASLNKTETKDSGFDVTSLSTIEEDAPEAEEGPIASTSTLPAVTTAAPQAPPRSNPVLTIDTSAAITAPTPLPPAINTPMALGMPVKEIRNRFNGYKIMAVLALNVDLIRLALEWLLHRSQDGAGYAELTARLESNLQYLTAMAQQANQREPLPPPAQPILESPSDDTLRKRLATSYDTLKNYFVASERFERQTQLRVAPISLLPPPASPRQRAVSPSAQSRTVVAAPPAIMEAVSTRSTRSQSRSQSPTKLENERSAAAYRRDSLSNDMAQEQGVAREQERLQALSDINIGVSNTPTSMPLRGPAKRDRSQSFPAEQHDDGSAAKRVNYESVPSPATSQFANSPRNGAPPFGYPPVDPTAPTPSPFHPPSSPANQQLAMQQQAFARQQQMATFTASQQQMMLAQQHLVTQRQAQAGERQRPPSANVESPRLANAVPLRRPGSALGHTSYSASSPPPLAAPSPSAQQNPPPPPAAGLPFLHVDARPLTEQYTAIQGFINSPNFANHPANVQQQLRSNAQQLLYRIRAEAAVAGRTSAVPVDRAASPMGIAAASPRHLPSPQLQQSHFRRGSITAGSATSHAGSPPASGNVGGTPQAESSSSFFREQLAQQEIQLRSRSPAPLPHQSPFPNYAQQPNYPSPADSQSIRPQQTFSRQPTPAQAGSPANYPPQPPSPAFINPSPRMQPGTLGGQPPVSNGAPVPARRAQDIAAMQERDRLMERRRVEQEAQIRAQDQLLARYQADQAREEQQQAMMRQQQQHQQQQQQAQYFQQEQYRLAQQNQMRMQQMQQQQQQQQDPRYGYAPQGYAPPPQGYGPPPMQQARYQQPPPLIPNPFATTQQPAFAPPPAPPSRPPSQQQQQQQYPPQEYPSEPVVEEPPAWDLFLNN